MGMHKENNIHIYFTDESTFQQCENRLRSHLYNIYGEQAGNEHDSKIKIIDTALQFAIKEFEITCEHEKNPHFYQYVFWLHEQATKVCSLKQNSDYSQVITRSYLSWYRRVLKFIIEKGCQVNMITKKNNHQSPQTTETNLNYLLAWGSLILEYSALLTEARYNSKAISFEVHNEQYDYKLDEMNIDRVSHISQEYIVDPSGNIDFDNQLKRDFKISWSNFEELVEHLLGNNTATGFWPPIEKKRITTIALNTYQTPEKDLERFLEGITLCRENKMSLYNLTLRPYKLNRYLYRPLVKWNIDNQEVIMIGIESLKETKNQYVYNAIPWGKAPEEWTKVSSFKKYINEKEKLHDKWLDDSIEYKLKKQNVEYRRNITSLRVTNTSSVNFNEKDLGEVDFIIINRREMKILITDSKHLLGRYDTINQRQDYEKFAIGSKNSESYNSKMSRKVLWFNKNKRAISKEFSISYGYDFSDIEDYLIEGLFIINTPTFYMNNSQIRIITIEQLESTIGL